LNNNWKRPGWGVPVWLAGLLPALLMACASAPATRPKQPTSSSASQPAEEKLPEQRAFLLPVPDPLGLNEEQVEGEVMVPLACHRSGRLQGGGSCLELFSPGTPISLADGTQRRVAAGVTLFCPDDHRRTPGMVLDDKPKQEEDDWSEPPAYAVWPSSTRSGVKVTQRPHPSEKPACRGWCSFGRRETGGGAGVGPRRGR
jgi:hypothetical protein